MITCDLKMILLDMKFIGIVQLAKNKVEIDYIGIV